MDGHEPSGTFTRLAAADSTICGLRTSGSVECWGRYRQVLSTCRRLLCGNGMVDDGESCDDGTTTFEPGEYCSSRCSVVTCGYPLNPDLIDPTVADALFVLRAAVQLADCDARVCDVTSSGAVESSDALRVLRAAVGIPTLLACPSE